jgi:hypothetical protein
MFCIRLDKDETNGQATARGFKLHWSRKYCVDVLDTIFDEWLYSSGGAETSYPPGAPDFALDIVSRIHRILIQVCTMKLNNNQIVFRMDDFLSRNIIK